MGYYTDFSLTMPRNPITPEELASAIQRDEELHYALDLDGSNKESSKGYEMDTSLLTLSAMYPTTVFCLHGEGEESADVWDKYFVGGKLQHEERLKGRVLPVPDFDAWVQKPDLTARKNLILTLTAHTQAGEEIEYMLAEPPRYLAIESAEIGGFDEKLFAMGAETIPDITQQINESDTERDHVTVYDLDTGEVLTPVFIVAYYGVDTGDGKNHRKIDVNGIEL